MDSETNHRTFASYEATYRSILSARRRLWSARPKRESMRRWQASQETPRSSHLEAPSVGMPPIASCGYDVQCSDAADNFVSHLQAAGFTAWPKLLTSASIEVTHSRRTSRLDRLQAPSCFHGGQLSIMQYT